MMDRLEALERLARLKADGMLSDEEFASQKAAVLAGNIAQVADTSPPAATVGEHWQEARAQSRGVRRFFRWFWLAQLAIVMLIGIYFLTRGSTREVERANQNAVTTASTASVTAPPVAAPGDTNSPANVDDVEITDAVLANPWNYDGDGGDKSTQDVCAGGTTTVHNASAKTLLLEINSLESAAPFSTLGELRPGASVPVRMTKVGEFVIGKTMDGGAESIFHLNVVNCHTDAE